MSLARMGNRVSENRSPPAADNAAAMSTYSHPQPGTSHGWLLLFLLMLDVRLPGSTSSGVDPAAFSALDARCVLHSIAGVFKVWLSEKRANVCVATVELCGVSWPLGENLLFTKYLQLKSCIRRCRTQAQSGPPGRVENPSRWLINIAGTPSLSTSTSCCQDRAWNQFRGSSVQIVA